MKEFTVKIKVLTEREDINASEISGLINRLINIGIDDARDTVEDGDLEETDHAQMVLDLNFDEPETFEGRSDRVLVVVEGGIAEFEADEGVCVEVFDKDNYEADPVQTQAISADFGDLAERRDLPVESLPKIKTPKI